jgi:cytochrome b561
MLDNPQRYGQVSRILHWGMALLLFWQIFTVGFRVLMEDSAIDTFMWSTHRPLGAILLLLVAIRLVWTLMNRAQRPAAVNPVAKWGHWTLYGLLVVVPALGLLRHYGAGRPLDVFGIPLFSGFDGRIEWLVYPGNLLHSSLGWLLMVMIVGHIGMAIWHRTRPGQVDVLPRMWGSN